MKEKSSLSLTLPNTDNPCLLLVPSGDDCWPIEEPWLRMDREGQITVGTAPHGEHNGGYGEDEYTWELPAIVDPVALMALLAEEDGKLRGLLEVFAVSDAENMDAETIRCLLEDAPPLHADHSGHEGVHDARTWIDEGRADGILDRVSLAMSSKTELAWLQAWIEKSAREDCYAVLYGTQEELERLKAEAVEARHEMLKSEWRKGRLEPEDINPRENGK